MKTYTSYMMQLFDPSGGHWASQLIGVAIAATASFLMPIKGFLFLIGAFIIADLYTGWRKSKKLNGDSLNSKGVGKTLEKTLMYLVLMLVSRGVDVNYNLEGTMTLSWFVGGLVIGREVLSIFENVDAVLGTNFAVRITEVWQRITGKHTPPNA